MAKTDSNYAFPITPQDGSWEQELGMTKKEYYIGQILSGNIGGLANSPDPKSCAKYAIELANEVISQLKKSNQK